MDNVIGPIDHPTWYCMRQCNEVIKYLKQKNDPKYQIEIEGEKDLYNGFMNEVLKRTAA